MAELISIKIDHFGQIDNLTIDFSLAGSDKLVLTEQQQSDFYGFLKFIFYGSKHRTSTQISEIGGSISFRMANIRYDLSRIRLYLGIDHITLRLTKANGESLEFDLSNKNQSPGRMLFGISSKQFIENVLYDVDYHFDNDQIEINQFTRNLFLEAWHQVYSLPHSESAAYGDERLQADKEYFYELADEIQSYDFKQFKRELQKHLSGRSAQHSSQVSLAELRNSSMAEETTALYKLKLKRYADLEANLRMWKYLSECQQKYIAERHDLLRQQQLLEQFYKINRLERLEKLEKDRVELESKLHARYNEKLVNVNIGTLEVMMQQEAELRVCYEQWQSFEERYNYCAKQLESIKEEARDGIYKAVVLQEEIDRSKLRIKHFQAIEKPRKVGRHVKFTAALTALVEFLLLIAIIITASKNERVYWLYPALSLLLPTVFVLWFFYEYRYRKYTEDGERNRLRNNELHLKKQQNDLSYLHSDLAAYNQRIDNREEELQKLSEEITKREATYHERLQNLKDYVSQYIPDIQNDRDLQRELSNLREYTLENHQLERRLRDADERIRELIAGDSSQLIREQAERAQQFLSENQQTLGTFPTMEEHQVQTRLHKLDHWLQQNERIISTILDEICRTVGLSTAELESTTKEQLQVKIKLHVIHLKSDLGKLYQRCLIDSLVNRYSLLLTNPLTAIQDEVTGSPNIKRIRKMEPQPERHDDFLRIKDDTLPLIVISNRFESKNFLKLPEVRKADLFISDH